VSRRSQDGRRSIRLAELDEGDFFGELALLTGASRSATVTALGGCEVLVLHSEDLAPILQADPNLIGALSRALAERSIEAHEAMAADPGTDPADRQGLTAAVPLRERIRQFFRLPA
jgi:CRP-like cAMP-binding protein